MSSYWKSAILTTLPAVFYSQRELEALDEIVADAQGQGRGAKVYQPAILASGFEVLQPNTLVVTKRAKGLEPAILARELETSIYF